MTVLKTTLELFSWLGERADFELPTGGLKLSKDPAEKEQPTTLPAIARTKLIRKTSRFSEFIPAEVV